MKIDIITIFPQPIRTFFDYGIFRRAVEGGVSLEVHDLRKWTTDKHKKVDDRPFGGGPGMVMKIEPMYNAVEDLKAKSSLTLLTSPCGEKLTTDVAKKLAKDTSMTINEICRTLKISRSTYYRYLAMPPDERRDHVG